MEPENDKNAYFYMKRLGLANLILILFISFAGLINSKAVDWGIMVFFISLGIMALQFVIGLTLLIIDAKNVNLAAALMACSTLAGILGFSACLGLSM